MKKFSKQKNYAEFRTLKDVKFTQKSNEDPTPFISELEDGVYKVRRYGYTVELEDGRRFRSKTGVRNRREHSSVEEIQLSNGDIVDRRKEFSGMSEVGGAMQGASYGAPLPIKDPSAVTRLSIDTKGFKIPNQVIGVFKIKDKPKLFSMNNKDGVFTGGIKEPTIGISKDNSIIRNGKGKDNNVSGSSEPVNKASILSLDWNSNRPFRLGVEPWTTTPLMSDADDGIYIATVKGDKLDTGKQIFTMMTKLNIDMPESVVVLIKQNKAYLFKQSQLTKTTGSRIFSENGTDCIQKDAEGNWRIISNKTGAYWKPKYESEDKAKAALRAYHANKHHSDTTIDPIESNGKVVDTGSENENFSDPGSDISYTFDIKPSEPVFEMQAVIGTLVMSTSFAHLLHLCSTDLAMHLALDEYYKQIPEKVDKLAEAYLSTTKSANFTCCIVPQSMCPVEFLTSILEYVQKYRKDKVEDNAALEAQPFGSLIDDIINLINSTLYKLKRLSSGKKLFSLSSETVYFSKRIQSQNQTDIDPDTAADIFKSKFTKKSGEDTEGLVRDLWELKGKYEDKYHRSPTKIIKTDAGEEEIVQFATDANKNPSILKKALVETLSSMANAGMSQAIMEVLFKKKK